MFQDVLLETTAAERRRRKLTLLITLLGESLVIAVLVAIPLLYLDALPGLSLREPSTPMQLSAAPHIGNQALGHAGGASHPASNSPIAIFRAANPHPLLPYGPTRASVDVAGPGDRVGAVDDCCGVPDGIPGGNYVLPPVGPPPPRVPKQISHLDEGMILKRVDPVYPAPAKIAGISGDVVLHAVIGRNGEIESLRAVSGHPLLLRAAIDAVQQWRFRPYVLNGGAIEVESQITVRFLLGR